MAPVDRLQFPPVLSATIVFFITGSLPAVVRRNPPPLFAVLWLTLLFRLGVLCLMIAIGLTGLQLPLPATLSSSVWYSAPSWLYLALFAAVATYGFIVSLGGRRAFGKILAEE